MNAAITTETYIENFLELDPKVTQYVDIGGKIPIAVKAKPAPGAKTLLVLFHGAMNRDRRTYPSYLNYRSRVHPHAHQISVADTSLSLDNELTNGWFAGSLETPLQELLPEFIDRLSKSLGSARLIFAGSSGGGFAALYYSWLYPNSVAIATVPQTNIETYYSRRRDAYMQAAWNETGSHKPSQACIDLRDCYKQSMLNTVIYLQSTQDHYHIHTQMLPFLSSLPASSLARVALKCSFWGKLGHSGAVPTEEMDAWIRAALSAPDTTPEEITKTYHAAANKEAAGEMETPHKQLKKTASGQIDSQSEQHDRERTKYITQYLLNDKVNHDA